MPPFLNTRRVRLIAATLALGGALAAAWALSTSSVIITLPVPGKGNLTYTCTQTSTPQDARARAEAAHVKFQADLNTAALALAPEMLAAMDKASTTGDRTDLEAANEAYKTLSKKLRDDMQSTYGCRVDTTLHPEN